MAVLEAIQAQKSVICPSFPGLDNFDHKLLTKIDLKDVNDLALWKMKIDEKLKEKNQVVYNKDSKYENIVHQIDRYPRLWSILNGWQENSDNVVKNKLLFDPNYTKPEFLIVEKEKNKLYQEDILDLTDGILFLTTNLSAGGAQRSLTNLCLNANLDSNFPKFAVCTCFSSNQKSFADQLIENSIYCFNLNSQDAILAAEKLLYFVSKSKVKKIVFWNADVRIKSLVAKFFPKCIKLIDVSPGDYAFERLSAIDDFLSGIDFSLNDYAQRIKLIQKYYCNNPSWLKDTPTKVIVNGVNFKSKSIITRQEVLAPSFLVNGRLAPSKKINLILNSFFKFKNMFKDAEIHFFGKAEKCDLEWANNVIKKSDGVFWHGENSSLDFYQNQYTAQITLGTHQGCPNSILESLSSGLSVIANDSGGTKEALINNKDELCGILLKEDLDEEDLLEAMIYSHLNQKEMISRGEKGFRHMLENFSMEKMVKNYKDFFASI